MGEREIHAALLAGDAAVMDRVINKYSRLLWPIVSAVLKNVGCEQDMEECIADAFIYLWQYPEKFDPKRGSLKSFLCILARSRAVDRYRQIARRETVSLEETMLADSFGMQEILIREETRRELLAALNDLGEPGKEILVRRYYYNQKPKEIALALDLTVKQVDNSLYRSKQILRRALQEVVV